MFQLKKGAQSFDFDLAGKVQSDGNPAGTWETSSTNQIVLTHEDGSEDRFAVGWAFNASNQLEIRSGGSTLVNLNTEGATPVYANTKDVLVVKPDDQGGFAFPLHGVWGLDGQHNLTFEVDGSGSTLVGFLQDATGQFSYHFFDLDNLANESILQFPGKWEHSVKDGKQELDFIYEKDDGTTGTFDLPGDINLDPNVNEFVYKFDSGANTSLLQFAGTLHVASDFTVSYLLSRETSSTQGSATAFTINAILNKPTFQGNLELAAKKDDGTPGTALTIGGSFTASLGHSRLAVGFNFTQPASGNTQTIGFNGSFESPNGNDVTWKFQSNASKMSIDLTGHIMLGPARAEGHLNIQTQDGQVKGIQALFGIRF